MQYLSISQTKRRIHRRDTEDAEKREFEKKREKNLFSSFPQMFFVFSSSSVPLR